MAAIGLQTIGADGDVPRYKRAIVVIEPIGLGVYLQAGFEVADDVASVDEERPHVSKGEMRHLPIGRHFEAAGDEVGALDAVMDVPESVLLGDGPFELDEGEFGE